ncbi:unnamed protein product [Acanthoscelides obtectus]|uniref:Large ribosomal subunit protein mL52 n=1 Tax=Acanthoscelides obtectus TaxID=200917 RepID=A0A9P0KRR4_ACAOB|nr:unnamed protein product [Acanthoscelides obtectus]CAK1635106.1 39S ribosomal protein L52, mitochondrial [Acanthoscelides obtectus]
MIVNQIGKIFHPCLLNIRSYQTLGRLKWKTDRGLDQKWRKERGLPLNPNVHGVLTDSPDYTFLDGRLTPYGVGQKMRILKQKEVLSQVIDLTEEVDFAVERHNRLLIEEENKKKAILDKKLKPKGLALLKKKK